MADDYLSELERRRSEIENEIRRLAVERNNLDLIIQKRRVDRAREGTDLKVTRRNERLIMTWSYIRTFLLNTAKETKETQGIGGLRTKELYNMLAKHRQDISYSMFRSYLHRMKVTGRVYQRHRGGAWYLPQAQKKVEDQEM